VKVLCFPYLVDTSKSSQMPVPTSIHEFLELVRKSGVLEEKRLESHVQKLRDSGELPADAVKLAAALVQDGLLTHFQAEQLMQGKWRRFTIGKYKVLERLGSGGMGSVFLCEHIFMRRRVAVKVLPSAKAADPSSLERFYREARAVAAVDHPNIVHAYDIDQDGTHHFIVMEFVDGPSLQEVVRRGGPVSLERACHYISQAAQGLDHASRAGLVHRDIKPGNILVDRTGVVKILDMGLARFFNDEEDLLTKKYDENVLGTADYLAPEQADDSHAVDVRADIYSLGGTFYFLLTGKTPFGEGTVPQKLMWHRTRQPKPVRSYRGDVPQGVQAVLDKMLAKEPEHRFQSPSEIVAALEPWTRNPIAPPGENEMPRLSPAVLGANMSTSLPATPSLGGAGSGVGKKTWQVSGAAASPKPASSKTSKDPTLPQAPAASATSTKPKDSPTPVTPPPATRPDQPANAARMNNRSSQPRPLARPKVNDESATWAAVGPDTADAVARGDTPPLVPAKPRNAKQRAPLLARIRKRMPLLLWAAGAIGALVLLGLATLLLFLLAHP
jgi:eukaryotic-like serine/threonine-protein kinase